MTATPKKSPDSAAVETVREKARLLRIHSIRSTTEAGSGHPTSCMSAAEIVAGLFFHAMRYDPKNLHAADADRFVLSKGHAAPVLYAALAEAGVFPVGRVMTLRQFDSELEGHPTPRIPGVDAATGSLGQGLSVGAGLALGAKKLRGAASSAPTPGDVPRVWVLLGDGEMAEGNVWEAANFAAHYKLDNLTAIVDVNALGQSERTMFRHDTDAYRRRFEALGWETEVIDGHDVEAVLAALERARAVEGRPHAIIARTEKGHGVSFLADKDGWHGKPVPKDKLEAALKELAPLPEVPKPDGRSYERKLPAPRTDFAAPDPPAYKPDEKVATRQAYGTALKKLAAVHPGVVALDGDVKNSTFAELFGDAYPDRFFQGYIAEQNLVGAGVGLAARGHAVFLASFACFWARAYDQIRMAAISRSHLNICGSHSGISIGEDGPSQMGLEDLAMFRAIPGATVLYPSDAVAAEQLTWEMARRPGICYLRTSRPKTPILYAADEKFPVPGFKVLRKSEQDRALVVAAGVTLFEALRAQEELAKKKINVRVIDLYCLKPLDGAALGRELTAASNRLVTVEDHYPEGGLGDAVMAALGQADALPRAARRLAVTAVPHSGPPEMLLDAFGISAGHVAAAVEALAKD